jgi:hypothetical protein
MGSLVSGHFFLCRLDLFYDVFEANSFSALFLLYLDEHLIMLEDDVKNSGLCFLGAVEVPDFVAFHTTSAID